MNGMSQTTTYTEGLRAQDGRQQEKIERSQEKILRRNMDRR